MFLLYPFWGPIPEPPGDPDENRFARYLELGKELFVFTSKEESEAFLLPVAWELLDDKRGAHRLAEEAARHNKPLIIFYCSDATDAIPIDNAIIFRTSGFRSSRKPNEFGLPGWSRDFLSYNSDKFSVRQKENRPSVSYCGYIDFQGVRGFLTEAVRLSNAGRFVKNLLLNGEVRLFAEEARLRGKAVRRLRASTKVEPHFVLRKGFRGEGLDDKKAARLEYADNLMNADYALVVRGAGNFSYRLYEVLSCGRIPVFVDTDCILPFDHLIDWKKFMVWVDSDKLEDLENIILEFHQKLAPEEFERLQLSIRKLYENWISPLGFFRNLWRCVRHFPAQSPERLHS